MLRQVRNARSHISCVTLVCFGNDVCLSERLLAPDALLRKQPGKVHWARSSIPTSVFRQGRRGSICIGVHRRLTIRSSRPHVVASATCFTLRLHMSAAPPRVGLTQALGANRNMTSISETVRVVCDLAGQVPGVTVLSSETLAAAACIVIKTSGPEAVNAIQFIALSANAGIEPWLREPELGTEAEQTIEARFQLRDGLEFGELQILGIHLVWHLHKTGLLHSADANTLLRKWNATQVGA
jgi:hypothetical protein